MFFVCDYGDYHHTQQALPVVEADMPFAEEACLEPSAYSQSRVALVEAEESDREEEGDDEGPDPNVEASPRVVILRMARKGW